MESQFYQNRAAVSPRTCRSHVTSHTVSDVKASIQWGPVMKGAEILWKGAEIESLKAEHTADTDESRRQTKTFK